MASGRVAEDVSFRRPVVALPVETVLDTDESLRAKLLRIERRLDGEQQKQTR